MFYLIVFFILLIFSLLNLQQTDRLSRPIAALMLICIAGLRYETGGDWDTYTKIFNNYPSLHQIIAKPQLMFNRATEEGFVLLCAIVKSVHNNVQLLFFVVTSINIILIASVLPKYTKYPVLALLCYYCILYFQLEMIYIRQATAVALCFYALQYVHDKKFFSFLFYVLLACTFHRVALVLIPLYFVLDKKLPAWVYLLVVFGGALVMISGISWIKGIFLTASSWLGEKYAQKAETYTESGIFAVSRGLSIGFILNLLIFSCVILFKRGIDSRPYGTVHLNMFALSLFLYYYCYELVEISNRFRLFFLISVIVVLPLLVESLPSFKDKLVGVAVVLAYCFSFAMGYFLEKPQALPFTPYQNYIEFKMHPRPSTGAQRLEISHEQFRKERKR